MNNLNLIKPQGVQNIINKFCYTIGMIPSSYKTSLTYEEQILSIGNYLEQYVYPAINNNAEALSELQNLFIDLKNYVDNYFTSLDVQEEINNKLDLMAENGKLNEIIGQYMQVAGILGYNTIRDMKNATNLINGSFAKTYGENNYNDGNGAFYKIRNITNNDVVDEKNIIALKNENLIAEKIENKALNEVEKDISLLKNHKYLFFGDSYGSGEIGSSWVTNVASYLSLNSSDYHNYTKSGAGFTKEGNTFDTRLDLAINEVTNKNEITDIVVCAGYNDAIYTSSTEEQIKSAIANFILKAKNNFPNAKISFAHVGWNKTGIGSNYERLRMTIRCFQSCTEYGCSYINNIEYSLHNYSFFLDDNFHPNSEGNKHIAKNLVNGLLTGSCDVHYETIFELEPTDNGEGMTIQKPNTIICRSSTNNGVSTFEIGVTPGYAYTTSIISTLKGTATYNCKQNVPVEIFKIPKNTCFIGNTSSFNDFIHQELTLLDNTGIKYNVPFMITVVDSRIMIVNTSNADIPELYNVAFYPFKIISDSLYC